MRAGFKEAWADREEVRTAVHRALAGGSAFRALCEACRKLREVM